MAASSSKAPQSVQALDTDELKLVQESWKVVMQNPEENAVFIFKTFLEKHNYYSSFKKFKGIPLEQLQQSRVFRSHSVAIIRAINQIQQDINNEKKLRAFLNPLGKAHAKANITEAQFKELKIVILDILRDIFKLQDNYIRAWDKIFDISFGYVFQALGKK